MAEKKNSLPSDKKRKRLVKKKAVTNPKYGKPPKDRSIAELLKNGLIVLDKPDGPTSHQIDSWVKEIINVKKVGHSGTLDPNATGILPIALNDAAKAIQVLLIPGKEYIALMKLHKDADKKSIEKVCKEFVGEVTQLPPVRSAVKRVKRKRNIYYLKIIQIKNREVLFRVGCESGTYVRTICVDIGKKLGGGAHLAKLRRTLVGHLKEEDAVNLHDLKDAFVFYKEDGDVEGLKKIIHPVEYMFEQVPKIIVNDSAVDALCHGANLAIPGVVELDSDIKKDDIIGIFTLKGEVVAIGKSHMPTEEIIEKNNGVCAELERVLLKQGTYPSIWKKS